MKTLMTLNSGFEIQKDEVNKVIHFNNFNSKAFGRVQEEKARIDILYRENKQDGCFGVLRANDNEICEWYLHLSSEEAVLLHGLLPQVEFSDERIETLETKRRKILSEVANHWLNKNCLILDTETTGLGDDAEIVEISVIDAQGSVLLNSLVRPSKPIPKEATDIHGITDAMVASAPTWDQLHKQFNDVISNTEQPLVIYNDAYDIRILNNTARIYGIRPAYFTSGTVRNYNSVHCAMHAYAEFYGQWDNYRDQYKWQKLTNAVKQCGFEVENAHRSLSDCQMTLQVLQFMAANGGVA